MSQSTTRGIDRFVAEIEKYVELSDWYRRKIRQAYRTAKEAHRGQFRDGGDRYFDHPREVALMYVGICRTVGVAADPNGIIAALLHDVVEDCEDWTVQRVADEFNNTVAEDVDSLTNRKGETAEDLQDRIESASPHAKLIKLADRLHNLSTLNECSVEKRRRKVQETEDVFLGIAESVDPAIGTLFRARLAEVAIT